MTVIVPSSGSPPTKASAPSKPILIKVFVGALVPSTSGYLDEMAGGDLSKTIVNWNGSLSWFFGSTAVRSKS